MTAAPTAPRRHVVMVGHGMAGGRLVDELLARSRSGAGRPLRITVVGEEPYGAYNRVLLSDVVGGRADVVALQLADPDSYRTAGVDLRLGRPVTGLDRLRHKVFLADGSALGYDRLVLATGARPVVPEVPGLQEVPGQPGAAGGDGPGVPGGRLPGGVHLLRTVDDAREIVAGVANARQAVVVGGGLLGLEAARGLAARGLPVTVLNAGAHLLHRQLDAAAGTLVGRRLADLGVRVRDRAALLAVLVEGGRVVAVEATSGDDAAPAGRLPVDLVVLACGVRPETTIARAAGLRVGRGVVVDDRLTTSDPSVHALGDCAEHDGQVPGLLAPAWEQARVLADLLTGADPQARYHGCRPVFRLKAAGLDVLAAGECHADPWAPSGDGGREVVQLVDPAAGRYVKAVVDGGRLVGAVCVGVPRTAAELTVLLDRGTPVPADRATLLLPGADTAVRGRGTAVDGDPTLLPDRVTVCHCNGVTKGQVVSAREAGARSVDAVAARTRAGTGCGGCRDTVAGLLTWLEQSDPSSTPLAAR